MQYEDEEGDKVLLTTDGDLTAAVYVARSAGWKVSVSLEDLIHVVIKIETNIQFAAFFLGGMHWISLCKEKLIEIPICYF